jgi:O-antigen/teichoic acid export membrane protein
MKITSYSFREIKAKVLASKLFKNIFSILILRGGNIAIQLLIIPVSIKFVSATSYGLWLTVSSMIAWLNIMDIGLSAGLRNKLSEAIAKKDLNLGKSYVSTTYALLAIMSVFGMVLGLGLIYFLNWESILDIPKDLSSYDFRLLLIIVAVSFFLTFFLRPIASIAYAVHKPATEYFILFVSNFINLILIFVFVQLYPTGNLLSLAALFCFTPIVVTFAISIYLYKQGFKDYSPSRDSVDFKYAKSLTGLSVKFFIIQISATVVFTTNNFMISHFFGNEDVTKYNIVSRYFNVLIILQSMILVPFWTMFTESYAKQEKEKIVAMMKKLLQMGVVFSIVCVLMVVISSYVYDIWIGKLVSIPMNLTVVVALFTILSLFASVFSTFLNGTGRITFQMYTSLIPSVLHIPLTILVVKYFNTGLIGVIGVSCFWLILTLPFRYLQYRKISSFKYKAGIWVS